MRFDLGVELQHNSGVNLNRIDVELDGEGLKMRGCANNMINGCIVAEEGWNGEGKAVSFLLEISSQHNFLSPWRMEMK